MDPNWSTKVISPDIILERLSLNSRSCSMVSFFVSSYSRGSRSPLIVEETQQFICSPILSGELEVVGALQRHQINRPPYSQITEFFRQSKFWRMHNFYVRWCMGSGGWTPHGCIFQVMLWLESNVILKYMSAGGAYMVVMLMFTSICQYSQSLTCFIFFAVCVVIQLHNTNQ